MISSVTIVACPGEPTQRLRTEGRKHRKGLSLRDEADIE
jgi:hypothetical protein